MIPMPHFMNPLRFQTELIYTLIVLILCLLIYLSTRELYNLAKHKGIGFFRNTFLFFMLAYIFRFIFSLFQLILISSEEFIHPRTFMPIALLFTSYLSTMAILFLTYSVVWKKLNIKNFTAIANIIAIAFAISVFFTQAHIMLIVLQAILLIMGLIVGFVTKKKSKKHPRMFVVYLLLMFFWILNFVSIRPNRFFHIGWAITTNLISIILFTIIYLKVRKWIQ